MRLSGLESAPGCIYYCPARIMRVDDLEESNGERMVRNAGRMIYFAFRHDVVVAGE